jgi:hypothetical protein
MSLAQQKLSCHGAGETREMGTGPATDSNGDSNSNSNSQRLTAATGDGA